MTASLFQPKSALQRTDGVWQFSRAEFIWNRFDYEPGDHVVFGGPTQNGKTTLAFQLLDSVATPECPAYVAVSKPRDPVTEREGKRLGFRRVETWPPPKKLNEYWDGPPRGYLVWPKLGNIDTDNARAYVITRHLLADRYAAGMSNKKGILVLDDTVVKSKILGLDKEMIQVLTMAGAMDLGMWAFVQKPTNAGNTALWSYSQSEHVFLFSDPDKRNQIRYDEIGGVDPKLVARILDTLGKYECLYIKRTGRFLCVVGAK